MTAEPTYSPVIHPGAMALRFVKYDARDDAVLHIRRDRGRFVRRWAIYSSVTAALVALVPMLVVAMRTEPAYLTNWVLLVCGIAFIAIVLIGTATAFGWSKTAAGKAQFDEPVLTITPDGLEVPTAGTVTWADISGIRRYGRRRTSLAISVDPKPPAVAEGIDDDECEQAGEDLSYAPPNADRDANHDGDGYPADSDLSAAGHFTGEMAVVEATDESPADPKATDDPAADPIVEKVIATPTQKRTDGWAEAMYGATHLIDLRECTPTLTDIGDTIAAVTHGRTTI